MILLAIALAVVLVFVFGWWQMERLDGAMTEEITEDGCVACGNPVRWVAEGAYRCSFCGHEGGEGWNRLYEEQKRKAVDALSPEERRRSGLRDLRDARTLLLAAQGTFRRALRLSRSELGTHRHDSERGEDKLRELTNAQGEVLEAQRHLRDATQKLEMGELFAEGVEVDLSSSDLHFDVHFDNYFTDRKVHKVIEKAAAQTRELLAAVEKVLRMAGAPVSD